MKKSFLGARRIFALRVAWMRQCVLVDVVAVVLLIHVILSLHRHRLTRSSCVCAIMGLVDFSVSVVLCTLVYTSIYVSKRGFPGRLLNLFEGIILKMGH